MSNKTEPTENNGHDNGRDEKGKFLPGNAGKPKGSSKNKLRDEIRTFLNENWSKFPEWFSKLKEKEKIQTMLDLLPYAVSRLQSISMSDDAGNPIEPKAVIAWEKLSPAALKEVLDLTTIKENGDNDN